jgi:hypothetical protein
MEMGYHEGGQYQYSDHGTPDEVVAVATKP